MTAGPLRYAVITPTRDEEANLPRLGACMAAQTLLPDAWVIVDNGSRDDTLSIAWRLASEHGWVRVVDQPGAEGLRRGAPSVRAFTAGLGALDELPDLVVNLDADVSVEPEYFERLAARFAADPGLGIAGGSCHEYQDGRWRQRHVTGTTVWGASRVYRWRCLQALLPLEERLGWDGMCEVKANSLGWRTAIFEDLPFRHHRREGQRDGTAARARAAQGRASHYMGYRGWYLVLRALHHARREPAALAMVWGYAAAALTRQRRSADRAAVAYLRRQQRLRDLPLRLSEALGRRARDRSTSLNG
jgi:biofilm PGA synthesis N-glycosyltransferase PgaC